MELKPKSKKELLDGLQQSIATCKNCSLHQTRTNVVPGYGNPRAKILFIGEAPGAKEDQSGTPFCGAAGKFLDKMLNSINLNRKDVFIANTLKCRPPENRDPQKSEKEACRHYLEEQIKIIDPKLIVCLGRHSVENFMPDSGGISKMHGKTLVRPDGKIYLALYHPAAALHNGGLRQTLMEDFQNIPKIIDNMPKNN